MKTIQVIFSKSTAKFAPFSWAIMWAEKTSYSHVAVRMIDDETKLPVYYQSSHMFVNCMGETQWLGQEQTIKSFEFQVDDELHEKCKAFAINKLGVPYGIIGSIGLGWVLLNKMFGKTISNPFKEVGATYVCSQFVAALLENAKNSGLEQADLDDMTPLALFPIVENLPTTLVAS